MNSRFRESSDRYDDPPADFDARMDREFEKGDQRRDREIDMICAECLKPKRKCKCDRWHLNKVL